MKKLHSILALLLCLCLVLALAACGAKEDSAPDTSASPSSSPAESDTPESPAGGEDEAFPSYTIGFSSHGAGMWIIDLCRLHVQHYLQDVLGFEFQSVAANFSAEQMVKDIQNSCQAGQDGHMYTNTWGTIMETCSDIFEQSETPWVNYDQMISEDMIGIARENPYFVGCVGGNSYDQGYSVGLKAAEDGRTKAAIIAGAIGDTAVDLRVAGFTEGFATGGGEIIAQARCSDPSEATQKGDDLVAAYGDQIDCLFGQNAEFLMPAMNALKNFGYIDNVSLYTAEPDGECLDMIRNGELSAVIPFGQLASPLASILLVNYLDGHAMLDEDGQAPYLGTIPVWMVTPDNADIYEKYTIDGFEMADEDYKELLYRFNPDVTYDDYCTFIENFNYDYMAARG